MIEPTDADRARDLAADLVLCREAGLGLRCSTCAAFVLFGQTVRDAWTAACRRALAAEAEVARLQRIVNGLADRVAAQSALLSRRAEKGGA